MKYTPTEFDEILTDDILLGKLRDMIEESRKQCKWRLMRRYCEILVDLKTTIRKEKQNG